MSAPGKFSSVGRKLVMGATGLMLIGFVITHLLGNLNLYRGQVAFNEYGENLHKLPGFQLIELGLIAGLLLHILTALSLIRDNRAARPIQYTVEQPMAKTWASRFMPASGIIVLAFLVVHIKTIKFGDPSAYQTGDFGLVMDVISNPLLGGIYLLGILLLGPHLRHGIQSCFRSLGLTDPRWLGHLDKVAIAIAAAVTVGFASLPVWAIVTKG